MDDVALELTRQQAALGRPVHVAVWGWGTLQSRIQQHRKAMDAFDPSALPHAAETMERLSELGGGQEEMLR